MTSAVVTNPATEAERERARSLWESDRARLMVTQPFLALLAMQLDLVPVRDPRLPTAATDGRSVFVDINFPLGLSRDERLFVLAHEVWHCAGRHCLRRGTRESEQRSRAPGRTSTSRRRKRRSARIRYSRRAPGTGAPGPRA